MKAISLSILTLSILSTTVSFSKTRPTLSEKVADIEYEYNVKCINMKDSMGIGSSSDLPFSTMFNKRTYTCMNSCGDFDITLTLRTVKKEGKPTKTVVLRSKQNKHEAQMAKNIKGCDL